MQCAKHQVAGFRRRQRQSDGLEVAHFAHQDHVRILTQRGTQRVVERQGVGTDLALVDQAFLGFVHEFDRVLHREDVAVLVFIDVVDHRRQRGRLARAGRPCHKHDTARLVGNVAEALGRVEFLKRQDLRGNRPHHGASAAVLYEGVDAEAGEVGDREREVALQVFLVGLALAVVHDVVDHAVHFGMIHRRQVDAANIAMDANHGRQAGRKMQVGRLVLDHEREEL